MLSIVIFFGKVKKRMAAVLLKDFHQKLVEEIKSLIPTEKKIVQISYRAMHENFVVSIFF